MERYALTEKDRELIKLKARDLLPFARQPFIVEN